MNKNISPVIQPQELIRLNNNEEIVIIDASAGSAERYRMRHLKGALFADVNTDLAEIGDFAKGGRHPLPSLETFARVLQRLGIGKDSHVIVYDDKQGANAAARLWWMLRAIGHKKVQVVDGGFEHAVKAGFPVSSKEERAKEIEPYPVPAKWELSLADMVEVAHVSGSEDHLVIDVRDAARYAGLTEPIDLVAGHIPGAINIPFTENLNSEGTFRAPEELYHKYIAAFGGIPADHTIVHCGSGITACHTLLALDYAGLPIPKLYVGSWSEWSRNDKEQAGNYRL